MNAISRRRSLVMAVAVVAFVSTACSGGGSEDDDALGTTGKLETTVQFPTADKVRLAGTFTLPENARKGGVPAVLLVPAASRMDRNGTYDPNLPDPLYLEISQAINKAGWATLRYDRRGVALSKLESGERGLTLDTLVGDAKTALSFLAQRQEVGSAPIAVLGYDTGGLIAMRVAAAEPKVKSVVLVSTPGRPLVEPLAEGFQAVHGAVSAQQFRSEVDTLLTTGALPGRNAIRAEHQLVLPEGQDELLKTLYTLDPAVEARAVKVPSLVLVGGKSNTVKAIDAERLAQALGSAQVVVAPEAVASLRFVDVDKGPVPFNPSDESTHLFGARVDGPADRDQSAIDRIAGFLTAP